MSEIVFVGTSDAFGAGGRRQAAILARAAGTATLLDCGGTTCTGLASLGIDRGELSSIVVSHFHGDHFGGIPMLLLAMSHEDRRREPLWIAGPPGVEARVRVASAALGHPLDPVFPVRFMELEVGRRISVGGCEVSPFPAHHDPGSSPHGLSIVIGGRRIVYSGDTGWFDDLPRHAAGADLFVCECTLADPGYPFHLSLAELVARRDAFDCGRMILTHLGASMAGRRGACAIDTADDGLRITF